MKGILFVMLLTFFQASVLFAIDQGAAEYSQVGNIAIEGVYHHADGGYINPLDPLSQWNELTDWLTGSITLDAYHRLEAEVWKAALHHSLAVDEDDTISYSLYEIYLLLYPFDILTVSLGRHRLNFGTSLVFSPLDSINPEDDRAADPGSGSKAKKYTERFAARLKGYGGFTLTLTPLPDLSISAAVSFDEVFEQRTSSWAEDLRAALVVSGLLGEFALFASTVYEYEETFRAGGGFSYDLFGFIIYAEAGAELHNRLSYPFASGASPLGVEFSKKPLWEAAPLLSAGVQRLFTTEDFTITVLAEYYFSGDSYTEGQSELLYQATQNIVISESYETLDGLNLPEFLGKHHFFVALGFDLTDKFYTEHTVLLNLTDWSFMVTHSICLTFLPQIDFKLSGIWMYGEKGKTEFGLWPEQFKLGASTVLHF